MAEKAATFVWALQGLQKSLPRSLLLQASEEPLVVMPYDSPVLQEPMHTPPPKYQLNGLMRWLILREGLTGISNILWSPGSGPKNGQLD